MKLQIEKVEVNASVEKNEELAYLLQAGCCCGGGSEIRPFAPSEK